MHQFRALKYTTPLLLFLAAVVSFTQTGIFTFFPVLYAFVLIPLLELLLRPNASNLSEAEEELARNDRLYDYILYLIVPLQYLFLYVFLKSLQQPGLQTIDIIGRISGMGMLCGVFGINVAHELGHRVKPNEQLMAKALLLTSLYTHFFIEHNKGHHKRVATPEDPSSARFNESLYRFYPRSIFFSYLSAWEIAAADQNKRGLPALHWRNEMLQLQVLQLFFITALLFVFGWSTTVLFGIAALIGILLLESVNYIEHYGLSRQRTASGHYERALPQHSWNSNHVLGRLMLFELSRHSDHHYLASRKYQVLRHHDTAPQMPTGYPGMMLLAHIPPLWFRIVNKQIESTQHERTY